MSTLPGRVNLTVSTASGESCTIAALTNGRVDQFHGAIERALKIPRVVQRLILTGTHGMREIHSEEFLTQLPLDHGSHITVINSWPQNPEFIVEKLKVAAASPATHPIALAVSGCLDHEDSSVQLAALQTLSWMGPFAAPHAGHIAKLLQHESKGIRLAAAESLSWLEEVGGAYAGEIVHFLLPAPVRGSKKNPRDFPWILSQVKLGDDCEWSKEHQKGSPKMMFARITFNSFRHGGS